MEQAYEKLRHLVLNGNYEAVSSELRLLCQDPAHAQLYKLISARMCLRNGHFVEIELGKSTDYQEGFFRAEYHVVNGFAHYYRGNYERGSKEFSLAAREFQSIDRKNRYLIAKYNELSGKINLEQVSFKEQLEELSALTVTAQELEDHKYLGYIHRQKSYCYLSMGRPFAAHEEILKSLTKLESFANQVEYQLGLCQAAYCSWLINDAYASQVFLEKIIAPVDERVLFPRDFVSAVINKHSLSSLDKYTIVAPYWKNLWKTIFESDRDQEKITWDFEKRALIFPNGTNVSIRESSLEGRLLRILQKGRATKNMLCEQLWPEMLDDSSMDVRFHRLISRSNKKFHRLIEFDGQRYQLACEIQI